VINVAAGSFLSQVMEVKVNAKFLMRLLEYLRWNLLQGSSNGMRRNVEYALMESAQDVASQA